MTTTDPGSDRLWEYNGDTFQSPTMRVGDASVNVAQWPWGHGPHLYWSEQGRLRVVELVEGIAYRESTTTLLLPGNVEYTVPEPRCAIIGPMIIDVTPAESGADLTLAVWATALHADVIAITLRVDTLALDFVRTDGVFRANSTIDVRSHGDLALIDRVRWNVTWRWRPALSGWAVLSNGRCLDVTTRMTPLDNEPVVVCLRKPAPQAASLLVANRTHTLEPAPTAPGESSSIYRYVPRSHDGPLTWIALLDHVRTAGTVTFAAPDYEGFTHNATAELETLTQPERYHLRLLHYETMVKAELPPTPSSLRCRFGPIVPVRPGVCPRHVTLLTRELGTGVEHAELSQCLLPKTGKTATKDMIYLLRADDASYGVFASRIAIPAGTWNAVAHVPPSGIISWQGLVDRYRIQQLSAGQDREGLIMLVFENAFELTPDLWWAAPFGGIGQVRGLARWCAIGDPAQSALERTADDEWGVWGQHWGIDLQQQMATEESSGLFTAPFLAGLLAPRQPGDETLRHSGPVIEVHDHHGPPVLRGFISASSGHVETFGGAHVMLLAQERAIASLGEHDAIETLPLMFQGAARIARTKVDVFHGEELDVLWRRRNRTLVFELAPSEPNPDAGVFVLAPTDAPT